MRETSAFEQLNLLVTFLSKKPEIKEIIEYISLNMSPDREICGVSFVVLKEDNSIYVAFRSGFKIELPHIPDLTINSNYPVAVALRTQNIKYEDFGDLIKSLPNFPTSFQDTMYKSTVSIPLSKSVAILIAFGFSISELKNFHVYIDCMRSILIMYLNLQDKRFIDAFELTDQLTPRQETIMRLISSGMSNREISEELSYSVSLIRQETMRIYAKLGVSGRSELKALFKEID